MGVDALLCYSGAGDGVMAVEEVMDVFVMGFDVLGN